MDKRDFIPKKLEFPDDWLEAERFDLYNPEQMRSWAIYMKQGLGFAYENFYSQDIGTKRTARTILNLCQQVAGNILDTYNEHEAEKERSLKKAQKKLGREFQ